MTAFYTIESIIGKSKKIVELRKLLKKVAKFDSNVLILGESGTGKELVAHALHNASKRKKGPFIPINCGAIPRELIESEMFGHKKGAFTGAIRGKKGKFELANKGSLFLDEIGELPVDIQVKLLRVLETSAFYPIGSEKECRSNFRLICATNRDLDLMVAEGKFRGDLFYRLNRIVVKIPPLRERKEDIPLLMDFFLRVYNEKLGKNIKGFTDRVYEAFFNYSWPGNVRELENLVEREVIFCERSVIDHISNYLINNVVNHDIPLPTLNIKKLESIAINKAMELCSNNIDKAHKLLGISKATLYRKLKCFTRS